MDNIKTKLQTQSTLSSCEKLNHDCYNSKISQNNVNEKLSTSQISKNPKPECSMESNIKYKDIISTIKIIYKEDGFFKGFFRGLIPRMLCNAPSSAISWGAYEFMKHSIFTYSSANNN